jgi:hypothetical protein
VGYVTARNLALDQGALDALSGSLLRTVAVTTADVAVDEQTDRVFASGLPYSGPGTPVLLDGRSGAVQYSIVVGGQDAWGWGG